MNNPNERKLFPNNLQESSKDPLGFIYSTYSAVSGETHTGTPFLQRTDKRVAYVSSAVGGSLPSISFDEGNLGNLRPGTHRSRGGGVRGKVRGFSRVSRRNLLRRLAAINRRAFNAFKGRLVSVTLTYPAEYPEDSKVCKGHLNTLRRRLQRKYGRLAAFWRMGIQKRGAWHFHLLLFAPLSFGSAKEVRRFVSYSWYEVCGKISEGHLRAGTRVEAAKKWKQATSYAERYLAKPEEFRPGLWTGRIWGRGTRSSSPSGGRRCRSACGTAFRTRKVFRKLARRRGSGPLSRMSVFVRHENVVRLLRFLGYCLE